MDIPSILVSTCLMFNCRLLPAVGCDGAEWPHVLCVRIMYVLVTRPSPYCPLLSDCQGRSCVQIQPAHRRPDNVCECLGRCVQRSYPSRQCSTVFINSYFFPSRFLYIVAALFRRQSCSMRPQLIIIFSWNRCHRRQTMLSGRRMLRFCC